MAAMPIDLVLERLDKVKKTGPDRYTAACPAHADQTPSLSVRATGDGTVLLRYWAGCETAAVVAALGLQWRDLFPRHDRSRGRR
jgi:hypothetical protein